MTRRLSLAFEQGLTKPEGRVAVLRPDPSFDLAVIPGAEAFHTDRAAMGQMGLAQAVPNGPYDMVVVCVPRAKALARALIAQAAMLTDGPIVVDGQRTDGVDSLYKACRVRADVVGTVTKAHGRLFWMRGGNFSDWVARQHEVDGWITAPGVFSADGVDPASAGLAQVLPPLKGRVADLGAGWGFLSACVLTSGDVTHLDVVEAEALALDCARVNAADPRAVFHWADVLQFVPEHRVDTVVMNPPFHTGRKGEPALGQAFIAQAAHILSPKGHLWMVANRHLPYEDTLKQHFSAGEELTGPPGFKIFHASRPKRA